MPASEGEAHDFEQVPEHLCTSISSSVVWGYVRAYTRVTVHTKGDEPSPFVSTRVGTEQAFQCSLTVHCRMLQQQQHCQIARWFYT